MTQFITEAKRMQHLANIKVESNQHIIEELLLEAFVEKYCLENKILQENLDEGVISKIKDTLASLSTKGKQALNVVSYGLEQMSEEGKKLYLDAIKAVAKSGLTPKEIKAAFGKKLKEAEDDEEIDYMDTSGYSDEEMKKYGIGKYAKEYTDEKKKALISIQKLNDFLYKTKAGKVLQFAMLGVMATSMFGPTLYNLFSSPKVITQAAEDSTLDSYIPSKIGTAGDVNAQVQGKSLSSVDTEPNTSIKFVKFDYGKGKTLNTDGEKTLDDIVNDIKTFKNTHPDSQLDIDITGLVSKTTGDVKKGTDTKDPLDQAREKTTQQKLNDKIEQAGLEGVKINIKSNPSDAYKAQDQEKVGGEKGAGAIVVIKATNLEDKTEVPPPFLKSFEPARDPEDTTVRPVMTGEKPGEETLPSVKPSPVAPSSPQDIETTVNKFPKLNRNGQIATVLAKINPELDISKKLGKDEITSYTDDYLMATQGDAKKLASLIINLRKNPDALLKKVTKATGIKLEPRAKAVATKVAKSTQAQLQSIKESSLISLLQEAMVDQISDEDIKNNQDIILALLGTMYASAGNTELSILPKDSEQAQKLKGLGFAPQPGGNYVFLTPGQTAKQVRGSAGGNEFDKKADQIKTKTDTDRVGKSLEQNPTIKRDLSYINTQKELAELIVGLIGLFKPTLVQDKSTLRTVLFGLRNRVKSLKEAEEKDVSKAINDILNNPTIKKRFESIDNVEEAVGVILREIFPMLNPILQNDEVKLKGAIVAASNTLTNAALLPGVKNKKSPSSVTSSPSAANNTSTNSSNISSTGPANVSYSYTTKKENLKQDLSERLISRMQKLAGIIPNKKI